jgi:amidase
VTPFSDYANYDAVGLAELVRRRDVHPGEIVEAAIERIERLNPALNAVVFTAFEEARERVKNVSMELPFAGVPMLLKDIGAHRRGWPTRQGSSLTPATGSSRDSTIVRRYEDAGAVLLGKANVPEFGIMAITESTLYGPARNPWSLAHSPGGSSGGSAAAVAAGLVPIAHAGDGGGSIRIPASCCGLVGLKPTRARTPAGPELGDVMNGIVIDHVLTRTVRDTAAMLDATAGAEPGDPYAAPATAISFVNAMRRCRRPMRIGFATGDLYGNAAGAESRAAVLHAARLCEQLGHVVEESSPDLGRPYEEIRAAFEQIWISGHAMLMRQSAALTLGREPRRGDLQGMVWAVYEAGVRVSAIDYQEAWVTLHAAARRVAAWHADFDVWLTPTLSTPPWRIGHLNLEHTDRRSAYQPMREYCPYTGLQNMTGQPAISLPLYRSSGGLPMGVHFVGRFGAEDTLLGLAAQLEEAQPWDALRPAIWN